MANVRVLILRAPGINCDEETAYAWEMAGAQAERLHVKRLIENPNRLDDYQVLTVPGGFSYGDDIASGRILATQLKHYLNDAIRAFLDRGGLVLGICNGFQVLVRMGLLPDANGDYSVSLTLNDSGRYEDRWVRVRAEVAHCPFLVQGEVYHLPVAHAEGKVVLAGSAERFVESGRIALRYVDEDGQPPEYPKNPNGSIENAAGLTDSTGRVFGLMPHPERNILATHSPYDTRNISLDNAVEPLCDGARIFQSAVQFLC